MRGIGCMTSGSNCVWGTLFEAVTIIFFDAASLILYESSTPVLTLRTDGAIWLRQSRPPSVKVTVGVGSSDSPLLSTGYDVAEVGGGEGGIPALMRRRYLLGVPTASLLTCSRRVKYVTEYFIP